MLKTSQNGIDFIKYCEGVRLYPYKDSIGLLTIGVGHLIKKSESFTIITETKAEELLRQDLRISEYYVNKYITVDINQNQFDALVSFTFNLGGGALKSSTLKRKINRGEYINASKEFKKWCYAGGKKSNGLLIRRINESNLFLSA